MVAPILLACIGCVFLVLGFLVVAKRKLDLFHSYHIENVSSEKIASFCKLSGGGILLMGSGMVVAAILLLFEILHIGFAILGVSFLAGLAMLAISDIKYNR